MASQSNDNPLQVVDITNINQETAAKLLDAATTQGFLMIEGHGIPAEEVAELFQISKKFFELSDSYKSKFLIDNENHGYTNYGGENLDPSSQKKGDPKEALNLASLNLLTGMPKKGYPDWFTEDPRREEVTKSFILKFYEISITILKLLAIGLKIDDNEECKGEDWFTSRYHPTKASGSTFRLLHYPGQKSLDPESVIRAGAHTDYGSITLLLQKENEEGLEIHSPVSKKWESVPFVPANNTKFPKEAPPIIVNIADQLSYWTAGLLKSTIHRVRFPAKVQETGQDRYSIVFFSHPNDETLLEPVPSDITRSREGRGSNKDTILITAREHLDKRLAATYKW